MCVCLCLCVFVPWRCDFSPALVGCASRHAAAACFFRDLHSSGSSRGRASSSRVSGRVSGRGCVTSSSFRLSGATTRRQLHKNATTQKQPVAHLSQQSSSPSTCPPLLPLVSSLPHPLQRCAALLCSFVPHSRVYEKLLKLLNKWIIGCLLPGPWHG